MLRLLPFAVLGLIFALPSSGRSQGAQSAEAAKLAYSKVAQSVDKDLNAALAELAKQREAIAAEKPALSKESNTIAADLREKRRLSELARTSREAAESEYTQAESKLKAWRDEKLLIEGQLFEFRKTAEAEQSVAKNEANRALLDDPTTAGHLTLLEATVQQLKNLGKIEAVEGEVLTEGGVFIKGTFAEAGPVSWFLSEDGSVSGLSTGGSDLRPRIVPETAQAAGIK
ncbi:MAG TPA: hypothetical protein PLA50_18610, partial [Bacteroidia bacterium]|nr:hypothetical protein [Bacteroidia bacterium]